MREHLALLRKPRRCSRSINERYVTQLMAHTTDQDWPSHYRAQAQECREYAAKATTQPLREEWLKMADEWITLAKAAEGSG